MVGSIQAHAVSAWQSRVDPGLSPSEAGQQIVAFLADAVEVVRPKWVQRGQEVSEKDGIFAVNSRFPDVCIVLGSRSYGLAAITVLTKEEGIRIRRDWKDELRARRRVLKQQERASSQRFKARALNREAS